MSGCTATTSSTPAGTTTRRSTPGPPGYEAGPLRGRTCTSTATTTSRSGRRTTPWACWPACGSAGLAPADTLVPMVTPPQAVLFDADGVLQRAAEWREALTDSAPDDD